jgi:thiol-disulfide isomerase/thioredoxin
MMFSMTNTACTNSNDEPREKAHTNANEQMIARNTQPQQESQSAEVYTIKSVGQPAAGKAVEFTWEEDGETKTFSEYTEGKVVFLNFWGTWCPPCRMEIPDIIEISNDMDESEFVVIGVAMEKARSVEQAVQRVSSYAKAKNIPYKNFIYVSEIIKAYGGINNVPTTFIIDKEGNIAKTIVGMRDKKAFMKYINMVVE